MKLGTLRLAQGAIRGRTTRLRLAGADDAEFIFRLRSDPQRTRFVSAIGVEVEAQRKWLEAYKAREALGEEYYFIIEDAHGAPVGTVRIYDYRGDSFSWGSWLTVPGAAPAVAMESALLVYEFAFGQLGFQRCHFEVSKGNDRVVAFHKRFGAVQTGEDEASLKFSYGREAYEALRPRYAKYLPGATPMLLDDCKIIQLPRIQDPRGNLTFVEGNRHVPFEIRRIFYLYDVPGGETRAGHALKTCWQMVSAVMGSFDVVLDDGTSRKKIQLNRAYEAILIPPAIWRELENFSSGAVCLVLASEGYSEDAYYREYAEYVKAVKG